MSASARKSLWDPERPELCNPSLRHQVAL